MNFEHNNFSTQHKIIVEKVAPADGLDRIKLAMGQLRMEIESIIDQMRLHTDEVAGMGDEM